MYNQHTRGMATTRHRSLAERGGRQAFVREKLHTQKRGKREKKKKKIQENSIFTDLKKRSRAHRASSKATRLFLTK